MVGLGLFLLTYIPDFIEWISGGMKSITGSMKAESPHIEMIREFFGLVLCVSLLLVFYLKSRKKGIQSLKSDSE